MKLVALVITLALWLGVSGLRETTTTRLQNPIRLNLQYPDNVEITNDPIQEVSIVVSGDKRKIEDLKQSDLTVSLDLTDVPTGEEVVQLTPNDVNIGLPTGIKLTEIQPSKIVVKLEAVDERDVPVKAETVGSPAENYEVYSQTVVPAKIRVRGPASYTKSLEFISTDKIDLTARSEDFAVRQIPVSVTNPKATALERYVDVLFRIGEKRVEKTFVVPLKTDKITQKATVTLYGAQSAVDKIRSENLHFETAKTDSGANLPNLILPADIEELVGKRKIKPEK